jgi:hypothetical protein
MRCKGSGDRDMSILGIKTGIKKVKVNNGKEFGLLVVENTALKLGGTFLLVFLLLGCLVAEEHEAANEKHVHVLEDQILHQNDNKLTAISRTNSAVDTQAFATQNKRALRRVQIANSKVYRQLHRFEKESEKMAEKLNVYSQPLQSEFIHNYKEMLDSVRDQLGDSDSTINRDVEVTKVRLEKASDKAEKILEKQVERQEEAKKGKKHPHKHRREQHKKRKDQWRKHKHPKSKRAHPKGKKSIIQKAIPELKVQLKSFKENKDAGQIDMIPAKKPTVDEKQKQMTKREKMVNRNLSLQRKLGQVFRIGSRQHPFKLDPAMHKSWSRIDKKYKDLLKGEISKLETQKRMKETEDEMTKLMLDSSPPNVTPDQWMKQVKHNPFRLFNTLLRRSRFADAKGKLHNIETQLLAKKTTTQDAWLRVQQLIKQKQIPADWTTQRRITKSAFSKGAWTRLQKQLKEQRERQAKWKRQAGPKH